MKRKITYILLVIILFMSPLVMPNYGAYLTAGASCVFVILCHLFKIQSSLKIMLPVVLFVTFMPITILTAVARPVSSSWAGALAFFCNNLTSGILLTLTLPALLAVLLHFALLKVFSFRRNRDGQLEET